MTFSEIDKLKALSIVHTFETSRPFGDYAACVVLDDGAGVSYGINQFTHRSGSLLAVVERYLANGGRIGREILTGSMPVLRSVTVASINRLAADAGFRKALKAAAVTREMKQAQEAVAFEKYLRPAIEICERYGFVEPLSLAVVYDSVTHGSWQYIAARVRPFRVRRSGDDDATAVERAWITEYVRRRHAWLTGVRRLKVTNYRTKFFLTQISNGNWRLAAPFTVHGVRFTEAMFPEAAPEPPEDTTSFFESAGEVVSGAARGFDRVDGVVTAWSARRDAAKSLWTTIGGTVWQTCWAVFGFFVGLPVEVWIVVAVLVGTLMLAYLYRQILLGKIREIALVADGDGHL